MIWNKILFFIAKIHLVILRILKITSLVESKRKIVFVSFILLVLYIHINFLLGKSAKSTNINVKPTKGYLVQCKLDCWRRYVRPEFYFLYNYLIKQYNWECVSDKKVTKLWNLGANNSSGTIKERVTVPDVIVFWELSISNMTLDPNIIKKLREYNPKFKLVYFCDDLHGGCVVPKFNALIDIFRTVDVFMSPYAYRFKHYFQNVLKHLKPEEHPEPLWIPHSASPPYTDDESLSFHSHPKPNLFLAGALGGRYPYRKWLKQNLKLVPNLVIYPHPGYVGSRIPKNQTKVFALELNKYLASFTCGLIYQYLVAKVFEIPATGSLLMVNNHLDNLMKALGFQPQVHYYNYSSLDPLADIRWVFRPENRAKVDEMRRNGMSVARSHHRTSLRAQAIYEYFHSGTVTYKIPTNFPHGPCPNVQHKINCQPIIFEQK